MASANHGPKTLTGRVEALETELAQLKAERALSVLTEVLGAWNSRCSAGEVGTQLSTAPPIPESYRREVARALRNDLANLNLLNSLDLWPKLQDVYQQVQTNRRRELNQALTVAAALLGSRQTTGGKEAPTRKKSYKKSNDGELPSEGGSYKATDFHPNHRAAETNGENAGPQELGENASLGADDSVSEALASANTHPAADSDSASTPEQRGGSTAAEETAKNKKTTTRKPANGKNKRRPVKEVSPMTDDAVKAALDELCSLEPSEPLNSLIRPIAPAQSDDDKGFREPPPRSSDRRNGPTQHVESDSGVPTRPRRSRKVRKSGKAP